MVMHQMNNFDLYIMSNQVIYGVNMISSIMKLGLLGQLNCIRVVNK